MRFFFAGCVFFYIFHITLHRIADGATQSYSENSVNVAVGNSLLYNSMIHPFMRMTIYGSIWYQGKTIKFLHGIC